MSYTNRGTVMHLEAKGDLHIENYGTIMHADSNAYNVTIINHGHIQHADQCSVINAKGQSQPQGVVIREVSKESDLNAIRQLKQAFEKKNVEINRLKLRIQELEGRTPEHIERVWGRKRIKELEAEVARCNYRIDRLLKDREERDATITNMRQEITQLRNREVIRNLESTNESLRDTVGFQNHELNRLRNEVADLQEQVAQTDRPKLIETIDDLRQQLKRSKNRERTSRQQCYQDGYRKGVADGSDKKKEAMDWPCRPSKEQAEAVVRQLRIWLDCETD